MSLRLRKWAGWGLLPALIIAGCADPHDSTRANAPPQGESDEQNDIAEFFAYHNDQGMMADMSIADIHFVPHSAELSGVGEARLERYAELLAETGGTLHYDTATRDEQLIEDRLDRARAFLAQNIPSNRTIEIALGLPGGRGMDARESLAGQVIAKEPEPRDTAYDLAGAD